MLSRSYILGSPGGITIIYILHKCFGLWDLSTRWDLYDLHALAHRTYLPAGDYHIIPLIPVYIGTALSYEIGATNVFSTST